MSEYFHIRIEAEPNHVYVTLIDPDTDETIMDATAMHEDGGIEWWVSSSIDNDALGQYGFGAKTLRRAMDRLLEITLEAANRMKEAT